jgi:hypothetical protein
VHHGVTRWFTAFVYSLRRTFRAPSHPSLPRAPHAGNWNEDQYGCDILSSPPAASVPPPSFSSGPRLFYPASTSASTFTTAGHDIVRTEVFAEKTRARMSGAVPANLLFPHRGAAPSDKRYQTSYLAQYGGAGRISGEAAQAQPSIEHSIRKMGERTSTSEEEDKAGVMRSRSYRTASSDAYATAHSILATPPAELTRNLNEGRVMGRTFNAGFGMKDAMGAQRIQRIPLVGALASSLDNNHRYARGSSRASACARMRATIRSSALDV